MRDKCLDINFCSIGACPRQRPQVSSEARSRSIGGAKLQKLMFTYLNMIKSFKHNGLERFFETGSVGGINPNHRSKISLILARLHAATEIRDMNFPGSRLHQHKGERKGIWSVDVSGNYRVMFEFREGDAYNVDYGDPH